VPVYPCVCVCVFFIVILRTVGSDFVCADVTVTAMAHLPDSVYVCVLQSGAGKKNKYYSCLLFLFVLNVVCVHC